MKPAPGRPNSRFLPQRTQGQRLLLALGAAVLLTLSFPTVEAWPLAWVALIPLLFAVSGAETWQAFVLGWLFGACYALGMAYWVGYAFSVNSNAGLLISILFLAGVVCGGMGLYYGIFALGACRVMRTAYPPVLQAVAGACLWVALEFCRAHLFSGIPWELLGYSQYRQTALIQAADVTGVYGISWVIVFCNYGLYQVCRNPKDLRRSLQAVALLAGVIVLMLGYGLMRLKQFPADQARSGQAGPPLAIVQGSIPQQERWQEDRYDKNLQHYLALTEQALQQGARLIIWPENTIQSYLQEELPDSLIKKLQQYNATLLTGAPRYERTIGGFIFFNSVFYLSGSGIVAVHDKMHLLPFGEYFPLGWIDLLRLRYAGPRQYSAGKDFMVFATSAGRLGALVCFEAIYPELARGLVKQGAELLVNVSNDAWFGKTSAHYQHFSMSAFRAIECRRPLLRAANTGISGFIDAAGRIRETLAPFAEGVLLWAPPLSKAATVYGKFGDVFAGLCFLGLLAVFGKSKKRATPGRKGR